MLPSYEARDTPHLYDFSMASSLTDEICCSALNGIDDLSTGEVQIGQILLEPCATTVQSRYPRIPRPSENPFSALVANQRYISIPSFTFECGTTIYNVPVAYKSFGTLSAKRDNVIIAFHAFTGSADATDWWAPLFGGDGFVFDVTRFFIICINCIGSPYGTVSPLNYKNGCADLGIYSMNFPSSTIRDDVNLFRLVLDDLGVNQVAMAIGGSLGGMHALEFAYFGKEYVRTIVSIASSPRCSAWLNSWGEAQSACIYNDPKFANGNYNLNDPPVMGLGTARISALLTYRSFESFEARFSSKGCSAPPQADSKCNARDIQSYCATKLTLSEERFEPDSLGSEMKNPPTCSVQSYLRYQANKFIKRFDALCYLAILSKISKHDVSRGRVLKTKSSDDKIAAALKLIEQPLLAIGIKSDVLFPYSEQEKIASGSPDCVLKTIQSKDGHDAFLLEIDQLNMHVLSFMKEKLSDLFDRPVTSLSNLDALNFRCEAGLSYGKGNRMCSED